MSAVTRMSTRMHPHIIPYPGKRMPPLQGKPIGSGIKALVSKLKKLITFARFEAEFAKKMGNHYRMVDLRITASYAAKKLRDVVDGKVDPFDEEAHLRNAIRVLEDAIGREIVESDKITHLGLAAEA